MGKAMPLHGRDHRAGGADPIPGIADVVWQIKIMEEDIALTTGDGKRIVCVDEELDGHVLTDAHAYVTSASTSGAPTIQIRNVTDALDMLSTRITIDVNEYTSYTAATPAVVNTANDQVSVGDLIAIDIDVAGSFAKGLGVILSWQKP